MTLNLAVPISEFTGRMQAARATLATTGADCAVLMAPEAQYWLYGRDSFLGAQLPQALILTPDGGEPSLAVLLDEAERIGVLVGGTYAMTATAFESLSGAGDVDCQVQTLLPPSPHRRPRHDNSEPPALLAAVSQADAV